MRQDAMNCASVTSTSLEIDPEFCQYLCFLLAPCTAMISKMNSNLHYTHDITPKRVARSISAVWSGGEPVAAVSDLTGLGIERMIPFSDGDIFSGLIKIILANRY